LCFNKSQRFVHSRDAESVPTVTAPYQELARGSSGPVWDSAGAVQIPGERAPGSTAFLWVETRGFKGHAQSFEAVSGQGKN